MPLSKMNSNFKLIVQIAVVFVTILKNVECHTPDDIAAYLNLMRTVTIPPPREMPCLKWDPFLQRIAENIAASCTIPTNDSTILVDVRTHQGNSSIYASVFSLWQSSGIEAFDSQLLNCKRGGDAAACRYYKTILNQRARRFACAQTTTCSSIGNCRKSSQENCYFTVCKFNLVGATDGAPYEKSLTSEPSCSSSACPSDMPTCDAMPQCCSNTVASSPGQIIATDPIGVTSDFNALRSVPYPLAKHMPCVEWSTKIADVVSAYAVSCTRPPSTDTSTLYDFRSEDALLMTIFVEWNVQNTYYDSVTGMCTDSVDSCYQMKTILNDRVNSFACARALCSTLDGQGYNEKPYYYTVCQFDQPRPEGIAYLASSDERVSCDATSCTGAKSKCSDGLCCYPNSK